MPASVLTMPEATKAVALHAQGLSQPQIAAHLGRSRKSVRTAFAQLGVKQRTPAEGVRLWLQTNKARASTEPHADRQTEEE